MTFQTLTHSQKEQYDALVTHPLQSFAWGEFREKTGIRVIRRGLFDGSKLIDGFTLTIHAIPHTPWNIGYLPKGTLPTKILLEELYRIGIEEKCIFIQVEPNVVLHPEELRDTHISTKDIHHFIQNPTVQKAAHPLFTKYTFMLDLTKSEEELLKQMHPKTRYNIKVATKHGVSVSVDNSAKSFQEYLRLTEETTKRQGFYAHTRKYHELQWETLPHLSQNEKASSDLSSFILNGIYEKKTLTTLLFFVFKDTLYYPYGASSNEHRNVMHSTLTMWEGIRLGKSLGLKKFDMWGAAEVENPESSNPYYGFHRFKQGFGAIYTEFIGSFDVVINPSLYQIYKVADKMRWMYLKLKK